MMGMKESTAFLEKSSKKFFMTLHRAGSGLLRLRLPALAMTQSVIYRSKSVTVFGTARSPEDQKFFGSSRSDDGASKTLRLNRPRGKVQKRTSSCCSAA
jgi:hypothetical protein